MDTRDPNCLFCKIIEGTIPAQKVLSTDKITAFRDINPQAPTHLLVVPNTHTPSVSATLDPQIFADVLAGAKTLAEQEGLDSYRLVINTGEDAGQTVFHLHLHLLGGRALDWPPG